MPFILASASPRRVELLKQIDIVPDEIVPADIDETPLLHERPAAYARRMASMKAKIISARYPDSIIMAADTVVACGQRILPKTETEEEARVCLKLLSGRRHSVLTAVSVMSPGCRQKVRLATSIVKFKRLSESDISAYLVTREWQGKAGGYAIQGMAATLITYMSGSYTGIVGLPLYEAMTLLKEAGI